MENKGDLSRASELSRRIVVEDGCIGLHFLVVVHYGRVVRLRMLLLEQLDDLCTSPKHWPVTMSRHHVARAIGIERRIEAHACTYAHLLNLPFLIHTRGDSMPAQLRHWPVDLGIEPALVDGMRQTIGVDSCGRGLQIGIIAIAAARRAPRTS